MDGHGGGRMDRRQPVVLLLLVVAQRAVAHRPGAYGAPAFPLRRLVCEGRAQALLLTTRASQG